MENYNSYVDNVLENFDTITKNPDTFLSFQESNSNKLKKLLKETYDYTKNEENTHKQEVSNALPELIIESFDLEQIWQQIELQNDFLTNSLSNISKFVVGKNKLIFDELKSIQTEEEITNENGNQEDIVNNELSDLEDNVEENIDINQEEQSSSNELSLGSDNESDDNKEVLNEKKKAFKKSIVDDDFFKLAEMENFLLSEEKKLNDQEPDSGNDSEESSEEDDNNESDIDLFKKSDEEDLENDDEEDDHLNNPKYSDFFENGNEEEKKPKRNKFFEEMNDDSDGEVENVKSTLELREERLKKKIEHLEDRAVQDKPWQLKGEVSAESRPYNSLLEEVVDFDVSSRPAPVMTEETSLKLEDIIKQRIKDKVFDSVQRKEKPVETPLEYKKKLVLDQEKSKESLAQIYEKEYLQQKSTLNTNNDEKEEEDPELHKEIKKMMHNLFIKLDALTNFHFTPKPVAPELKIVSNLPAVNMEEVAPVAVSDAALLAPEEVKSKQKGDVMGKDERSDTDKKRERRKKKLKQREHSNAKKKIEQTIQKMKPGLGNKYSKEKAKKLLEQVTKHKNVDKMDETYGSKALKSSTAFFTQLEDEVKSQIKTTSKIAKRKNDNRKSINAKKMKL